MIKRSYFHKDNESAYIKNIQNKLRVISKDDPDILPVYIDGIYGIETQNSVKSIQRKFGYEVTGAIDRATFDAINSLFDEISDSRIELGLLPGFDGFEGKRMRSGDIFDEVYVLKILLRRLGVKDERFYLPLDGTFDEDTEKAVKLLQGLLGYEQTGHVDRPLCNDLLRISQTASDSI